MLTYIGHVVWSIHEKNDFVETCRTSENLTKCRSKNNFDGASKYLCRRRDESQT